ncbi:WD40 domain-containing protein [Streptomyces cadmiisoli]|uniref:WD40 domain-containing protein n=1 Tax=Streptomyces cadmiisoli TaxID=2184053 RepID=UPI00366A47BE
MPTAPEDSLVRISSTRAERRDTGTGFVIGGDDSGAHVVTCHHVLEAVGGADAVQVNGARAEVLAADPTADLAVLRVDGLDAPVLPLSPLARTGDAVSLLGFAPFGRADGPLVLRTRPAVLSRSTSLYPRAGGRPVRLWELSVLGSRGLETGNSGGPVLDRTGAVVAVVNARQPSTDTGYAVSVEALRGMWNGMPAKTGDTVASGGHGGAPDGDLFVGRAAELGTLHTWTRDENCRMVALVGAGGVGKSALVERFSLLTTPDAGPSPLGFDHVSWCRLLNAPPVEEIVEGLVRDLSEQAQVELPDSLEGRVDRLLHCLTSRRCLVVLDNLDSLLSEEPGRIRFRKDHESCAGLLRALSRGGHRSCVLITGRRLPDELSRLEDPSGRVRFLRVEGLDTASGVQLLASVGGLTTVGAPLRQVVERCSGNPLVLQLAARHIRDVFGGDVGEFLADEGEIFDGLDEILTAQLERLAPSGQDLLLLMAALREPRQLGDLRDRIINVRSRRRIALDLELLQRSLPLERSAAGYSVQPMMMEFLTQVIISRAEQEILDGEIDGVLHSHALLSASSKEYIRTAQRRVILDPLLTILGERLGEVELRARLLALAERERLGAALRRSHVAGNVINLLGTLDRTLGGVDFSSLVVREAHLQELRLADVNFRDARFEHTTFPESLDRVYGVAASADGAYIAAGCADGRVTVWRRSGHTEMFTATHDSWVRAVAFSPDAALLATGGGDTSVRVWRVGTGERHLTLDGHAGRVRALAFGPDSDVLFSAGDDGAIKAWSMATGAPALEMTGHTGSVRTLSLPAGDRLYSAGDDGIVRIWAPSTGTLLDELADAGQPIWSLAVDASEDVLVHGSPDGTVAVRDLPGGAVRHRRREHTGLVWSVVLTADGTALSAGEDRLIRCWDIDSGTVVRTIPGHTQWVRSLALCANDEVLVSGGDDRTVRQWEMPSGRCVEMLTGHMARLWSAAFSPDGGWLAGAGNSRDIRVWDAGTGRPVRVLRGHEHWVWQVAFSPDGTKLASAGNDRTVRLWDVAGGRCTAVLTGHTTWVWSVAFAPDGTRLASGADDGTVRVWTTDGPRAEHVLRGHSGGVRSVCFSSSGHVLASGGYDGRVMLWDVRSGERLHLWQAHRGVVRSVAVTPDGTGLATGGDDGAVRVWRLPTGEPLRQFTDAHGPVRSLTLTTDGRFVVAGSDDGHIRFLPVRNDVPPVGNDVSLPATIDAGCAVKAVTVAPATGALGWVDDDGAVSVQASCTGPVVRTFREDRAFERVDIRGASGIGAARGSTLRHLGAIL